MRTIVRVVVAGALLTTMVSAVAPPGGATAEPQGSGARAIPRWVRHVQRFPGGISNGVRASIDPGAVAARSRSQGYRDATIDPPLASFGTSNVQMNADSNPPYPQNETSVAFVPSNPSVAVAAANDYVSSGFVIMRTTDGGTTWSTHFQAPEYHHTFEPCFGSDPWIAYSVRDQAFYLVTLCYFASSPASEVHVWKSTDQGLSWTPSDLGSVAASNYKRKTHQPNASVFLDNNQIVIDNNPTSPHFGRIYVTYVKFHMLKSGFSDYCPVKVAYTDDIPTNHPRAATWQHAPVVPDQPGDDGMGASANQWPRPQVESDGTLDIAYASEDCNSGIDRGFYLQKSTDGGQSFMAAPVRIDGPGQFVDNPKKNDSLPNTAFRAPGSTSLTINQVTGTLAFVYQNNVDRMSSGADISLEISNDGGVTWSDQRFISVNADGTAAANDQFFPSISSDADGNLYAVFFDRRLDPANHDIDTFEAISTDDGATWTNVRISTTAWDPDMSFFGCGCFIGDYNGIAASTSFVYPVWTDGRDSAIHETGTGETDIFTDVEQP